MDDNLLQNLLKKYKEGKASSEEMKLLESWYLFETKKTADTVYMHELKNANDVIWKAVIQNTRITEMNRVKPVKLWRFVAIAASITMMLTVCFFFYKNRAVSRQLQADSFASVLPGGNKAVLTLANGKTINLSAAKKGVIIDAKKLAYNDGSIVNREITEQLTMSTPRGGTYQVILSDGTSVWLNAASSLKFPSTFSGQTIRKVQLSGEAYFEVAKQSGTPFIVVTDQQEVEVMGTHFNINSYSDNEDTKTTLLEGAVKVSPLGNFNGNKNIALSEYAMLLKPGQQALQKGNRIAVKQADVEQAMAWKEGWFCFKSTSLQGLLSEASKWYDLDVVYEGKIPADHFTGKVPRSATLGKFIKMMELSDINIKIEGRKMIIDQH